MSIETLLMMIVVSMCPLSLFVGVVGTLLVVKANALVPARQVATPAMRMIPHDSLHDYKIVQVPKSGLNVVALNMRQRGWEVELCGPPHNGYYDITFRRVRKS